MADPVSWLQIEQGWNVVTSDGGAVGTVAQVEGDQQTDIFDGLAITPEGSKELRYVPGEIVGLIYPGEVTLKIAASETGTLAPFEAAPPTTTFHAEKAPLSARISRWLGGKR